MKYPKTYLALLALGGASLSFAQSTNTISPPPKPDGSVGSRAPFPQSRNDVKSPDGSAIDASAPAATVPAEPLPAPAVTVMGPTPSTTTTAVVVTPPAATTDAALSPTGRTMISAAASLESTRISPSIRAATFTSRESTVADIDARLTASEKSLAALRSSSSEMSASGKTQFKTADDVVKEREKALRSSIRAARNASETEWDSARSKLAADYEAYASALASVDAAAGTAPIR
jgi:hypothetical protein